MATAKFKVWRGDTDSSGFVDYDTDVSEGMVVLDAVSYTHLTLPTKA